MGEFIFYQKKECEGNEVGTFVDTYLKDLDLTQESGWDNDEIDSELIQDGYVYFEKTEVQLKKKKITAMLQLLNPSFCSKVRVYDDPFAGETFAPSVGGVQVTKSYAKSHYVKVGNKTATKVAKKDYDDSFGKLFGSCAAVKKEYGKDKSDKYQQKQTEEDLVAQFRTNGLA